MSSFERGPAPTKESARKKEVTRAYEALTSEDVSRACLAAVERGAGGRPGVFLLHGRIIGLALRRVGEGCFFRGGGK